MDFFDLINILSRKIYKNNLLLRCRVKFKKKQQYEVFIEYGVEASHIENVLNQLFKIQS